MSDFMEGLFTHELTPAEYGKIIKHCCKQLQRLGYYIEDPWSLEEDEEQDETSRIMEEDRD